MKNNPNKSCKRCRRKQHDPRLRVVIKLISEKFREPICVCELGRLAGLSPSELSRLFKEELEMHPKRLQTLLRMVESADQLFDAERQIKSIAADVGLPVVDTFIRNFCRAYGITPGEFQELMHEEDAGAGSFVGALVDGQTTENDGPPHGLAAAAAIGARNS